MGTIGILAYGSLIANPRREIEKAAHMASPGDLLSATIPFETPFEVEYARKSTKRSGAPTLVPVPEGIGKRVAGLIIVLQPDIDLSGAKDILYRREIDQVGDTSRKYNHDKQRNMEDAVVIKEYGDHSSVDIVIYASLKPSPDLLDILQDNSLSKGSKAHHLACAARDSITADTYFRCRDGVRYLADVIRSGIDASIDTNTLLTEAYRTEILKLANNAPDLEEARFRIARDKGLIGE